MLPTTTLRSYGSTLRVLASSAALATMVVGASCCREYVPLSPTFEVADLSTFTDTTIELLVVTRSEYEAIFGRGIGFEAYWGPQKPPDLRDIKDAGRVLTLNTDQVKQAIASNEEMRVDLVKLIDAGRVKWKSAAMPEDESAMYLVVVANWTGRTKALGNAQLDMGRVSLDSKILDPDVAKSSDPKALIKLALVEGGPVIQSVRAIK